MRATCFGVRPSPRRDRTRPTSSWSSTAPLYSAGRSGRWILANRTSMRTRLGSATEVLGEGFEYVEEAVDVGRDAGGWGHVSHRGGGASEDLGADDVRYEHSDAARGLFEFGAEVALGVEDFDEAEQVVEVSAVLVC